MKIRILGAGPAGLSFAALMKRLDPSHDVAIVERSARDAFLAQPASAEARAFLRGEIVL